MNKHQLKTEQTKRKLLKSARRVFSRDGFEASRIDDIARAAGFTRGAFYAHFKTKEDLFFALLEEQADRWIERVQSKLLNSSDDQQRVEAFRESYIANLSDKQWPILLLEFKLYAVRHPKMRAKLAEAHRRIRMRLKLEKLQSCIPAAWLADSDKSQQVRVGLEAVMSGLVLHLQYDPSSLSTEGAESILQNCFDALVGTRFVAS